MSSYSIRKPLSSLFAVCVLLTFTLCATAPGRGQCRNSSMPDFFRVGVLQDKPFVAERIEVQVRTSSHDQDQVSVLKQSISRDRLGRIRIETGLFSKHDEGETRQQLQAGKLEVSLPEKESQHWIQQFDCTTNRELLVQPDRKMVTVTEIPAPAATQPVLGPYGADIFQKVANIDTQDLGFSEIAGIKSHGAKWVTPPSPGDPNNPLYVYATEKWVSEEWALTLKESFRRPQPDLWTDMRVLAFRPDEPDPASFEVPADYKTVATTHHSSSANPTSSPNSPTP